MAKFEFLIQKEGDRAWLPLESPDVEILEGRYRVVARSGLTDTPVEIRVTHESTEETPPKRRVHKSSRRTTPEGLMVVLPFTYFKPGFWELRCGGEGWHHAVQLESLPRELDEWGEVSPRSHASEETEAPEGELEAIAPEPSVPSSNRDLNFILDRQAYSVRANGSFELSGRVEVSADAGAKILEAASLRVYLRDPQTLQRLVAVKFSLPESAPPVPFSSEIEVPSDCQTRLMLGEVQLCDGVGKVLVAQSFSVTVDLEPLLDAIADEWREEYLDLQLWPPAEPPDTSVDLSAFELLKSQPSEEQPSFQVSPQQALPPQVSYPSTSDPQPKPLDLPTFSDEPEPPPFTTPTQSDSEEADEAATEAQLEEPPSESAAEAEELPAPDTAESEDAEPVASQSDRAFQSLDLEGRFWSRLHALARDSELSHWLALEREQTDDPFQPASEEERSTARYWESREIVVEDDPLELPLMGASDRAAPVEPPPFYRLDEQEPVPMPELVVPEAELIAGRSLPVRVRLAQVEPRIYVKLWLQDCQSRLLLDGPRWLTEFLPTGLGYVESTLQVTIPHGSLEARFEAIAVEIQTQRESHKASVVRAIAPPDPPSLPLDDEEQ